MTARATRFAGTGALLMLLLAACGDSSSQEPAASVPAVTPAAPPAPTASAATAAAVPAVVPSAPASASPTKRSAPSGTRPSAPATHTPAASRHAAVGKDFTLGVGESARIDGTQLVVTFARLLEDSRCPTGVTCIRAGEALIAITVRGGGGPSEFQLQVPANEGGANQASDAKRVGGYVLHLVSVDPYPVSPAAGATATPEVAPTATLRVTSA